MHHSRCVTASTEPAGVWTESGATRSRTGRAPKEVAMTTTHGHRPDLAHHHPTVRRSALGRWTWSCACGGASCRTQAARTTWREAVVEALLHSMSIAP
jgi:hypothetical protein